jgi:flavin-dependent dehydrogenase
LTIKQIRSEFDELLLRHAEECGATVLEEHKVTELGFESSDDKDHSRPRTANYINSSGGKGCISFDYLVDASGRNGIMSTKVSFSTLSISPQQTQEYFVVPSQQTHE